MLECGGLLFSSDNNISPRSRLAVVELLTKFTESEQTVARNVVPTMELSRRKIDTNGPTGGSTFIILPGWRN